METSPKATYYNSGSMVCGLWLLLTGWIWPYFACLLVGYPVGVLGLVLWNKGRRIRPDSTLNKAALIVHIVAVTVSLAALALLLFYN